MARIKLVYLGGGSTRAAGTMASLIANEFSEASSDAHLSALMAVGFTLFVITIIVNALARLLVRRVSHGRPR